MADVPPAPAAAPGHADDRKASQAASSNAAAPSSQSASPQLPTKTLTAGVAPSPSPPPRLPIVVLKLGSSSIVDERTGFLALSRLSLLVERIASLKRTGHRVILVTSGAVGVGMRRLGMPSKPKVMSQKQVRRPLSPGLWCTGTAG